MTGEERDGLEVEVVALLSIRLLLLLQLLLLYYYLMLCSDMGGEGWKPHCEGGAAAPQQITHPKVL